MNSFRRIAEPVFLIYLTLFLFVFAMRPLESDDNWWHLKTGQWIATHGQVPHEDPFSFAGEHTRWVCIHWLGSLAIYSLHQIGGLDGLRIFKSLYFVLVTGIFYCYARRKVPLSWLAFLCLPLAYVLLGRLLLRPDVFNFFFIQVFLIQLFYYERTGDRRAVFTLPLWSLLWNNVHLGSFIYGTVLIAVFLGAAVVRSLQGPGKAQVRDLGLVLALNFAALLINPYGWEGFLYPFKVFLQPEYIGFYQTTRNTVESQSSVWAFFSLRNSYCHILLLLGLFGVILNRKDPWTLIGLLIAAVAMFLGMIRNGPFFALVCAYVFAEGASRAGFLKKWTGWSGALKVDIMLFVMVTIIYAWHILGPMRLYDVYDGQKIPFLKVTSDRFSDAAIRVLTDNHISGPVFCGHLTGNEILWKAYPDLKPIGDGRYLDLKRYRDVRQLLGDPARFWPAAEEKYRFKIAVLDAKDGLYLKMIDHLAKDPQWQIIALKGTFIVYVKKGAFPLSQELNGFQQRLRAAEFLEDDNEKFNELMLRPVPSGLTVLPRVKPRVMEDFNQGVALMQLEYYPAAFKHFSKAMAVSNEAQFRNGIIVFLKKLGKL